MSATDSNRHLGSSDSITNALLACGVIGALLFVVAFLVQGATRAGYNPLRHPVSSLAIGELGWLQRANFLVTGVLMLALAVGLRALRPRCGSWWGPVLVGVVAIGLICAGVFVSDPLSGYPPGTPDEPLQRSLHGVLHDLFSALVFFGLPAACFVFARRFAGWGERGWALYSALTGAGFIAAFVITSLGFGQVAGFVDRAGLLQRITIVIGWAWLALLAVHLLRSPVQPKRQP